MGRVLLELRHWCHVTCPFTFQTVYLRLKDVSEETVKLYLMRHKYLGVTTEIRIIYCKSKLNFTENNYIFTISFYFYLNFIQNSKIKDNYCKLTT